MSAISASLAAWSPHDNANDADSTRCCADKSLPRKRSPRSRAFTSATMPLPRWKSRTDSRLDATSLPWPPAFMRTAPPTEPGTPTPHSKPVSPRAALWRASTGSATAPPATTRGTAGFSGQVIFSANSPSTIASPANPSSATSRLLPRPITSTGTRCSRSALLTACKSSIEVASRKRLAGPPTLYVVNGASSTSRRTRGPSSTPTRSMARVRRA